MIPSRKPDRVPVICYHRILPAADGGPLALCHRVRGTVVDMETFEHQIHRLTELFQPVEMAEYLAWLRGSLQLPAGACLVTFDDGYRDFVDFALPVLERRGVPATHFVTRVQSGPPERLSPPDRWYSILESWWEGTRQEPAHRRRLHELVHDGQMRAYLHAPPGGQRDLLATLAQRLGVPIPRGPEPGDLYLDAGVLTGPSGGRVTVASHGWDHLLLTTLPDDELRGSLQGARSWIRAFAPAMEPTLAYPNGSHDHRVRAAAERAGFRAAFTVRPASDPPEDPLMIPRSCIPNRPTAIDELAEGKEVSL